MSLPVKLFQFPPVEMKVVTIDKMDHTCLLLRRHQTLIGPASK